MLMIDPAQSWLDKVAGQDCPFECLSEEVLQNFYLVAKLDASTLYLERNQTYRGYCVLVYDRRHVARVDQLSANEWSELARDLHSSQCAIWKTFSPAHVNIASLGNVVPHLHWHLIPRYMDDPRWGHPIWPADTARLSLQEEDYSELADRLRRALQAP
jgi:diadenosine tetraphosphate (Ap4A) HIT family hydrolase